MKNSLILPISSRRNTGSFSLPELSPDAPVEAVLKDTLNACVDSQEREVNIHISEATLNAERNRRLSQDLCESDGFSPILRAPEVRAGRKPSVSFGNESEIAYVADGTPVVAETSVRHSKEFDGNRSGRKSVKQ